MTKDPNRNQDQAVENILIAADHGRLDLVTKFLEGGADPNTVDEIGISALHNAAKRGHWHIARLLLENKASPTLLDGNNSIPLHLAIRAGHKEIVRLLLECDPSMCEFQKYGRHSPIHIAAVCGHAEIVQNLLDCGATTLDKTGDGTALHLAALKGHDEVCDILLKHDKSLSRTLWERMTGPSLQVHSKSYDGKTPFVYAVEKHHNQTVEVFLRHYPELVKTTDGDFNKWLLFHRCIELKQIDLVRIFLRYGVDLEMRNSYGKTALHLAVAKEDTELIQLILDHGAIIDARDKSGMTPEDMTMDPKIRMILRNHARARSKSTLPPVAPIVSAPPPEYKA
ncbi:Ankyrin-3 [Penicillium rolfsii]|nr:Ankyrin-3 [Penicillium rolfsii]